MEQDSEDIYFNFGKWVRIMPVFRGGLAFNSLQCSLNRRIQDRKTMSVFFSVTESPRCDLKLRLLPQISATIQRYA